jgi:hypothetical protein
MLDIVAPDQQQAAARVDRGGVDHGKARLAPAHRADGIERARAEAAHHVVEAGDQRDHDHEGNDEAQRERHLGAE